jgi:hypothetical protein
VASPANRRVAQARSREGREEALELTLMVVSSVVAIVGIGHGRIHLLTEASAPRRRLGLCPACTGCC